MVAMTIILQILLVLMSLPCVFAACRITPNAAGNVEIPAELTTVIQKAFNECAELKTVTFASSSSLGSIGDNAFSESGLTSITIPASVTSIGSSAFLGCSSLKTVIFANGSLLGNIPKFAFQRSALTSIALPASVTSIGNEAFFACFSVRSTRQLQRVAFRRRTRFALKSFLHCVTTRCCCTRALECKARAVTRLKPASYLYL